MSENIFDHFAMTSEREHPGLEKWVFAMVLALILSVVFMVKGQFIHYILAFAPKGHPINIHILIEEIVITVLCVFNQGSFLVSFVTSMPVESFFGTSGCRVVYILSTPPYKLILSCGLTIYRFLIFRHPDVTDIVGGKLKLMWAVVSMEIGVGFGFISMFWIVGTKQGFGFPNQFCKGQTKEMSDILFEYNGGTDTDVRHGKLILLFALILIISMVFTEFGIYHRLMSGVQEHDQAMLTRGVINQKSFQARRKTSIISLKGQFFCFCANLIGILVSALIPRFFPAYNLHSIMMVRTTTIMVVAICQLLASPDMRRHLNIKLM